MVKLNIYKSLDDKSATRLLKEGAIGVIPTDTQYGLVCAASDPRSVKRLYDLKNRDNKPGTIIAHDIDQLVKLGIKARYLKAVENFWPNAISVIIPTGLDLEYLHQGKQTLAVRIPKDRKLNTLLKKTGPLLTSSANDPGKDPAGNILQAVKYFGDKIDFYVDGGDKSKAKPSTIIRVVDDAIEILRPGAIEISESGRLI